MFIMQNGKEQNGTFTFNDKYKNVFSMENNANKV